MGTIEGKKVVQVVSGNKEGEIIVLTDEGEIYYRSMYSVMTREWHKVSPLTPEHIADFRQ